MLPAVFIVSRQDESRAKVIFLFQLLGDCDFTLLLRGLREDTLVDSCFLSLRVVLWRLDSVSLLVRKASCFVRLLEVVLD